MASSSPLSSILKSSRLNASNSRKMTQPLQVRFDTTVTIDVAAILKGQIESGSDMKYLQLLNLKNNPHVNDAFLLLILQQVNKSVSLLVEEVGLFVDALLSISWTNRPPVIVDEYLNFIQTLVSAHTYYSKSVFQMLASNFTLNPETNPVCSRIHEVISHTHETIPSSEQIIFKSLMDCFPYIGSETADLVNYVKNLLQCGERCQFTKDRMPFRYRISPRDCILKVVIERLVKLDSRVPRDELLKLHNLNMELNEDSIARQATNTLDELMKVMFQYCQAKRSESWDALFTFYNELWESFETFILSAVGIHHIHFLILYITSTNTTLYENFTERLWNLFNSPASDLNKRKAAADYLASFLGKANFLPVELVIRYLEKICDWIHAYLDRQLKGEGAALFKVRAHSAFYAACHVPFYVVAARHHDFMDNKKVLTKLQSFDLPRIVNSTLNPLRYCHPTCVRQFAESASHLQIAYCHTIMIKNQRLCIPETTADTFIMDTEYPFEKYLLPSSSDYVSSLTVDKPIGRDDSLYDADQVMEELLSESPRVGGFMSESPRVGGFMHHFMS